MRERKKEGSKQDNLTNCVLCCVYNVCCVVCITLIESNHHLHISVLLIWDLVTNHTAVVKGSVHEKSSTVDRPSNKLSRAKCFRTDPLTVVSCTSSTKKKASFIHESYTHLKKEGKVMKLREGRNKEE